MFYVTFVYEDSFAFLLTRAPRGTDRSPEYKEHFCYKLDSRVKNVTTEWNQKQQHFITHALDHCPALDPPLGGSGRKTTTLVRDHEYFIPTKFHQNPSSSSGEEVENVKSLRTDGRTDDGRCAMTIAHSSLRLRWAKNHNRNLDILYDS